MGRQLAGETGVDRHGDGGTGSGLIDSGLEPAVDQHRRRDAPGKLPQLRESLLRLVHGSPKDGVGALRVLAHLFAGPCQVHVQPHQALLRAVMDVAFQAPQRP